MTKPINLKELDKAPSQIELVYQTESSISEQRRHNQFSAFKPVWEISSEVLSTKEVSLRFILQNFRYTTTPLSHLSD